MQSWGVHGVDCNHDTMSQVFLVVPVELEAAPTAGLEMDVRTIRMNLRKSAGPDRDFGSVAAVTRVGMASPATVTASASLSLSHPLHFPTASHLRLPYNTSPRL